MATLKEKAQQERVDHKVYLRQQRIKYLLGEIEKVEQYKESWEKEIEEIEEGKEVVEDERRQTVREMEYRITS